MLDQYYLRPKTADRIRALWLGPAIGQYAAWASERGAAKATVTAHLQALIHFDRFAQSRGATTWTDLPTLLEPFVEHWMQAHGTRCTGDRARQSRRSHARTPVEQMLRLLVPGFVGTTTRRTRRPSSRRRHHRALASRRMSSGTARRCISSKPAWRST